MAAAVIAQFKEVNIRVEVLSHVTEERLDFVISEVVRLQGLVVCSVGLHGSGSRFRVFFLTRV